MLENKTFILIKNTVLYMVLIRSVNQYLLNTFVPGLFCILGIQKSSRHLKSPLSWGLNLLAYIIGVQESISEINELSSDE